MLITTLQKLLAKLDTLHITEDELLTALASLPGGPLNVQSPYFHKVTKFHTASGNAPAVHTFKNESSDLYFVITGASVNNAATKVQPYCYLREEAHPKILYQTATCNSSTGAGEAGTLLGHDDFLLVPPQYRLVCTSGAPGNIDRFYIKYVEVRL